MKRLIIFLAMVVISVYAVLAVLGSGGEYAAEKLLYGIMKNASTISLNPDAAPPAQLAAVERDMKLLLDRYPQTKAARLGHVALVEFYIANKKYKEAMDLAVATMKNYGQDTQILSTVQFLKGVIHEKEGRWNEALGEFRMLKEKYPATQLGMQIPLYIAKYYDAKGKDAAAQDAYREAERFYRNMEREYSGKVLGYTAASMLTQVFINSRDYERAGESLKDVIEKYPSNMTFVQITPTIDFIYLEKLKNPDGAIEVYKSMKSKTQNKKLINAIDKKIEKLEEKKKQLGF